MPSLNKSVKPEIGNRYDLWVLRHIIGGARYKTFLRCRFFKMSSITDALDNCEHFIKKKRCLDVDFLKTLFQSRLLFDFDDFFTNKTRIKCSFTL
jgi:hypothetical protein